MFILDLLHVWSHDGGEYLESEGQEQSRWKKRGMDGRRSHVHS